MHSECRHVDFCVDAIFSLLRWRISKHKLIAFASLCKVLGVQLDLRQSGDLLCFVSNTEERVEELTKEIDDILTSKLLTRVEGEKLRRRLQFASSQVFGRKLRRLLKVLSNHVTQGRKVLSDLTLKCFSDISQLLPESTRRRISASQSEILRIYVDAIFDISAYSGLGGVVINMSGEQLSFFRAEVAKRAIDSMTSKGQRTILDENVFLHPHWDSFPDSWLPHFFTKTNSWQEKGFFSKVSRAGTPALPCENHARKMRTFFTRRLEPRSPHGKCAERLS